MRTNEIIHRIAVSKNVNIIGQLYQDQGTPGDFIYCATLANGDEITGYRDHSVPRVEIACKCEDEYKYEVLGDLNAASKIVHAMETRFKKLVSENAASPRPSAGPSQRRYYSVDLGKGESLPDPDWVEYCDRQNGVSNAINNAAAQLSY